MRRTMTIAATLLLVAAGLGAMLGVWAATPPPPTPTPTPYAGTPTATPTATAPPWTMRYDALPDALLTPADMEQLRRWERDARAEREYWESQAWSGDWWGTAY